MRRRKEKKRIQNHTQRWDHVGDTGEICRCQKFGREDVKPGGTDQLKDMKKKRSLRTVITLQL